MGIEDVRTHDFENAASSVDERTNVRDVKPRIQSNNPDTERASEAELMARETQREREKKSVK